MDKSVNILTEKKVGTSGLFKPVLLLGLSILAFIFVAGLSYNKVTSEWSSYKSLNEDIKKLEDKKNSLQAVGASLKASIEVPALALPEKNPTVWAIANIRNLAIENTAIPSGLKLQSGSQDIEGISDNQLTFRLQTNDFDSILNFFKALSKTLPLVTLKSLNIASDQESGIVADAQITIFNSKYPEKLPNIEAPVTTLTQKENELLNQIAGYKIPDFTNLLPSNENKENLFN